MYVTYLDAVSFSAVPFISISDFLSIDLIDFQFF
jgi:hypothetical protein